MPVQGNVPKSSMTDKHLPGMKLMHRTDKAGEALSRSPKRRSRLASLIESDPRDVDASVKYRHASNNELDIETRQRSEHEQILKDGNEPPAINPSSTTSSRGCRQRTTERECQSNSAPPRRRRPNLRILNPNDADAVLVEGEGGIKSLRDIQSSRVFAMNLQRLSDKDTERSIPVQEGFALRPRRHTLFQAQAPLHCQQGRKIRRKEYLPGKGRRMSLPLTAYEPSVKFLMETLDKRITHEVELAQATAKATEAWKLKTFPDNIQSQTASNNHIDPGTGRLDVAGQLLRNEDVEIIAHLLRQNYAFRKLDLSRCLFSNNQLVCLAQALAWNCQVEELYLKGNDLSEEGSAALADMLTVNDHIRSIDFRGCRGIRNEDIEAILEAANSKSSLVMVNGIELAALRTNDSDVLDLSGWDLGYEEAMIVGHCLHSRDDGLRAVDLHKNSISSEALNALVSPLRKQSNLRSIDLSYNEIDERALRDIAELLHRNINISIVKLTFNRITCNEYEHHGINLMRLLSSNTRLTTFDLENNDVSSKMLNIVAEKLAANRAMQGNITFLDCLHLKYPRTSTRPALADPRKLYLEDVDERFMIREGIKAVHTTVRTDQASIITSDGVQLGLPFDHFFVARAHSMSKAP